MRIRIIDDEDTIQVARKDIIEAAPDGLQLEIRRHGNLRHLGYYLPNTSKWVVGEDSEGAQVLLEVRK